MKNFGRSMKHDLFLMLIGACLNSAFEMSKRKHHQIDDETREALKNFKNLGEEDVFITEYINKSVSFTGIIKERYTDFQVNEIDLDGNVVELTNLTLPERLKPPVAQPQTVVDDEVEINTEGIDENEIPVAELVYPIETDDQWKQLTLLWMRNVKQEFIKIEITKVDKEGRKKLHHEISARYKNKLITNTIDKDKKKFMVIGTNVRNDRRVPGKWTDVPHHLYAVLYKENIDTIAVVQRVINKLKVHPRSVTYAGNKDRRAVTSQRICLVRMEADRLRSLFYNEKTVFGNYEYRKEPLKLGDLQGNRFRIALRRVEASAEDIENTLLNFKKKGFINYYGLQRFGSYSDSPTHEIGKSLISKQWKEAIDLILRMRAKDDAVNDACRIWNETADAKKALQPLKGNRSHSIEESVLKTLSQQGNTSYVNALQKLPKNVTMLYLHAFQSVVWNRIVSRRVKEFGINPIPGDLVYKRDSLTRRETLNLTDEKSERVRAISADEIKQIGMEKVVYPLPGYAIKYPENVIGKWYEELLEEYDVKFDKNDPNKAFTLSGDYRKMMVLPQNLQWKTVFYNNPSADLILTDYQKLTQFDAVENFDEGTFKAVILEFGLPASTYATMALREITKTDTSASYQASLTQDHLQDEKMQNHLQDEEVQDHPQNEKVLEVDDHQ